MAERQARKFSFEALGARRGSVVLVKPNGAFAVRPLTGKRLLTCDLVQMGPDSPTVAAGDEVIFLRSEEVADYGYIIGTLPRLRPRLDHGRRRSQAAAAPGPRREKGNPARHWYMTTGCIERRDQEGIWVSVAGCDEPVLARLEPRWDERLLQGIEARRDRLLVEVQEEGRKRHAVILGLPVISPDLSAGVEAARIILEGREEIVLRTQRAMIVLRASGEIEILGTKIKSRARESQKIAAPMLKLN